MEKPVSNGGLATYANVISKTDSGFLKQRLLLSSRIVVESALYADSLCLFHKGHFRTYHSTGLLKTDGNYVDGRKSGIWLSYHSNGMIADSALYAENQLAGIQKSWHRNTEFSSYLCSVVYLHVFFLLKVSGWKN